jgi:7,8-dihydro-6-hydroxymethylpterin-pyrophosphokinase
MMLYQAVIDHADSGQLLSIRDKLADLEQRVDEILPMSQFNAFLSPADDDDHPQEIDIWVAIEGELTPPQLSSLEQEVESATGQRRAVRSIRGPRIVEKLIRL